MANEILFTERQRFKQWWLWLILLGINGLFLFGVFKQVINGQQFGDKPMSNTGLLIAAGLTILLMILFLNFRLDTLIKKDGIYVRFFPFHLKFKYFAWEKLTKSFVRHYSPIAEYGGWGLRYGFLGNGKAYNVSGDKGLQIEFTDSKRLLIGTNKPEELTEVLKRIGQLKQ
ncbi:hypothetical protein [Flavobacterium microcysteis]|uniref:Bacterial Pleckstrin homology domain-containing protein n=1 Tax=Flavobacterium microcysteis TaxID=2596891 RepID=A0A501QMT2_9FLAO|nr:hypothetical protein [Flavobacterium microcysteis]TPD73396.1 hypothetical protein FJA49_01530 [Flavobacterium microcysteis]